jgi:hypothetical protein
MPENVITQVAAVGRQRAGSRLDHFIEAIDLMIDKRAGLVSDHQIFKVMTKVGAMQLQ